MKLINFQTLTLEEYNERDAPPYAILSHTWAEEEVTFADWNTGNHGAHLAGFSKIAGFISTAHGMYDSSHGWVDTCCIDKSSSAELTEAINSMFRYYSNATVCIVHLADVPDDLDINTNSDVEAAICQARWLSRGWTLQELIAPHRVEFFGRTWRYLGTLAGKLLSRIATETGIPHRVLASPYDSSTWSIAQRMSWASKRRTTRVEDKAYSLLGIFDVSLPLIYGEGKRAFMRLQEEIIKRSADHSIFAWDCLTCTRDTLHSCEEILAESPADFTNDNIEECYQRVPGWTEPFEMTNFGLRMRIPLMKCKDLPGNYHGVLNCCIQSRDKGPIALNLAVVPESWGDAGAKSSLTLAVMPRDVYWPLKQTFESRRACSSLHIHRTSVVDEEDLLSMPRRDVLVLRRNPYVMSYGLGIWRIPANPELDNCKRTWGGGIGRIKMVVNEEHSRGTRRRWALPEGDWDAFSDVWFARDCVGAITFGNAFDESSFTVILSHDCSAFRIAVVQNLEQQDCVDLLSQPKMLTALLRIWPPNAPIQFPGKNLGFTVALQQHDKTFKTLNLGVVTVRGPSSNPPGGRNLFKSTMPSTPRPSLDLNWGVLPGNGCVAEPWKADAVEGRRGRAPRKGNRLGKWPIRL